MKDFLYEMEIEWMKIATIDYEKIFFQSIPYHALSTAQVK